MKENLFEIDNARNMSPRQLVDTFVPTESFWRLLTQGNQIILGSRGSGKTALVKMLSHDHLVSLDDVRAKKIIKNKKFFGIYLPTHLEWVSALKNKPWQTTEEKERFFQWRLNIASCMAFLNTSQSCLKAYVHRQVPRALKEKELCLKLSRDWFDDGELLENIDALQGKLESIHFRKHVLLEKKRTQGKLEPNDQGVGFVFDIELFLPLKRGIQLLSKCLDIGEDSAWLVCIDEAEFLDIDHHRILNSHMRSYNKNLFFKITTMPYCHYTRETNTNANLVDGHDFEYIFIDSDKVFLEKTTNENNTIGTQFGRKLFKKRVDASGFTAYKRSDKKHAPIGKGTLVDLTLRDLLGYSIILDPKDNNWKEDSQNMALLEKHASSSTISRAHRLIGTDAFPSQISRKIHGALILRDEKSKLSGNDASTLYSGARMVLRCGDNNPRRLIRIFNKILLEGWPDLTNGTIALTTPPLINTKLQNIALSKVAESTLSRVKSEPKVGPNLHSLLSDIGNYFHHCLHKRDLSIDQINSVEIDATITDEEWKLIETAIGYGLLVPNIGSKSRDELPYKTGTFRLAGVLSPKFFLLPTRGKSHKLSSIRRYYKKKRGNRRSNKKSKKQYTIYELTKKR